MLQAWIANAGKYYCQTRPGQTDVCQISQADEISSALADAAGETVSTVIVFDFKAWLKTHEAFAQLPLHKVFDVRCACYVHDPLQANETIEQCAEALKLELPPDADSVENQLEMLFQLYERLQSSMQENFIYQQIEMPLSPVLAAMETHGLALDAASLRQFGDNLSSRTASLAEEIYALAGEQFNLNSTRQLSNILFEKLQIASPGRKTKSGYSTDAETLEKIRHVHPIIELLLQYRKLAKVNSTYVEGLLKYQQPDGRLHTTFNMFATATGRLSSSAPNLQNLPSPGETGGEIRKFLTAGSNWVLIDADYSQIELRILAHMANDPVMIRAFKNQEDIHAVTAAQIFNVQPDEVTAEMRRKAKAVNFGIVYGISAFALGNDLDIPQKEAQEYIKNYFQKYSAVKTYLDQTIKIAKQQGYVETLFGRRRNLPELQSKVFAVRSFGERAALNMPIQGTAADLIKLAMIKTAENLQAANLQARLLLQIHDELLLAAPENEVDAAAEILRSCMENIAELQVPLAVTLACGKNYLAVK